VASGLLTYGEVILLSASGRHEDNAQMGALAASS